MKVSVHSCSTVAACPTIANHLKAPNIAGRALIGHGRSQSCLCAVVRSSTEPPSGFLTEGLWRHQAKGIVAGSPDPLLRLMQLFWGISFDAQLAGVHLAEDEVNENRVLMAESRSRNVQV